MYLLPLLKEHLYSEERVTFSVSQNQGLTSIQQSQTFTSCKEPCLVLINTLTKMMTAFATFTLSLKLMYFTWGNSEQNITANSSVSPEYKGYTIALDCLIRNDFGNSFVNHGELKKNFYHQHKTFPSKMACIFHLLP